MSITANESRTTPNPQSDPTYSAGWREGMTDALTAALARIPAVWDHMPHSWAHGYWDAVLERQIATVELAWNSHPAANGATQ